MTKRLLLILILTGLFFSGKSQTIKLEYGFQGGLNSNYFMGRGLNKDHNGILTGFSIGGHIKMKTSEHFGLKILLSYDENGYAYRSLTLENSTSTGFVKADVLSRHNYINMPVLAEYSFGSKVTINLDAGAFIGVMLNSQVITKYKQPLPPGQQAELRSSSNNYHPLNYGISLGLGIQIPISSKIKLDFDLRNYTGLNNIVVLNRNNSRQEANCFAILGGLSFEL
jgi:hypothetical protein